MSVKSVKPAFRVDLLASRPDPEVRKTVMKFVLGNFLAVCPSLFQGTMDSEMWKEPVVVWWSGEY
jgi:hypothetical protein